MRRVPVDLANRSYEILIDTAPQVGLAEQLALWNVDRFVLITDANVFPKLPRLGLPPTMPIITLPSGEKQKCLATVEQVYEQLFVLKVDRKTAILACGGGVIGDLAGFVASTYNRGLPLVMVPTTLLAMVDSSVGGKVGINLASGKNLVGSFYQPRGVWVDTGFLSSLPEREFRSGLAEVVKYGMILEEAFFTWLEANTAAILRKEPQALAHLIQRCCELKAMVVKHDEYETKGLRAVLNLGHTFGHALETVLGYETLLHGEAVAIGMDAAARLAVDLKLLPEVALQRQRNLLHNLGLATQTKVTGLEPQLLQAMRGDKKNQAGKIRLILPIRIGEVKTQDDVNDEQILHTLHGINHA